MADRPRNVPLWTAVVATLAATVLCVVDARCGGLPGLAALEGLSIDARFKLRGARDPATDRIVIVGIDDATRAAAPEILQTRRGYARLLDAISACKPRLVALDVLFGNREHFLPAPLEDGVRALDASLRDSTDPALAEVRRVIAAIAEVLRGDEALADAIRRSGRVFLGAYFRAGTRVEGIPEQDGLRLARHGEVADSGGGGDLYPITADHVTFSLPMFARGAIGAGAVNDYRDPDGVRRRMPVVLEHAGRFYMSLGLAVALEELGRPRDTVYIAGEPRLRVADTTVQLTTGASLPIDVLGPRRIPRVSGADVLAGTACGGLRDKLVFVGHTYGESDKVVTPLDPVADGVELHATLAENLLGGHVLAGTGWLATVGATLALCGIVCVAQLRRVRRRAWVPPLLALAALAAYVALALALFSSGTVIALAAPAVLTGLVLLAATIGGLATEGREKAHLRGVFSQYVSRTVVDRILADPARARVGGERKELTVLFSDIRGFSQVAERMAPEDLAGFLGEYLTPMTDLVLAAGGTLDKYIGDAVMAFWGAPIDTPDHAVRACEVALRMQEALVPLNAAWTRAGRPSIAIGIGVNTGAMAVGNMGSHARFEYTVLGEQVNLGSRLEALTKEYGVAILVGEATARAASENFALREIDLVRVVGRAGAAPVFELVGRAGHPIDPRFAEALAAYRDRRFAEAREGFAALANDPAAAVMARRCEVLATAPPPEDWDGVYEQRAK